jgi:methionyl-tRNA formyltransferase
MDKSCESNPDYKAQVESSMRAIKDAGAPDLLVTFGFPMVPPAITGLPTLAAINFHPSDLPAYRGLMPLEAMILDCARSHRFTAHHIAAGIDDGEIIAKSALIPIPPGSRCHALWSSAMADVVGPFFLDVVDRIRQGAPMTPEELSTAEGFEGELPVAFGRRLAEVVDPADGTTKVTNLGLLGKVRIEWAIDTAEELERASRAFDGSMSPWMKLYSDYGRRPFAIDRLSIVEERSSGAAPGTICEVVDDSTVICATVDGRCIEFTGGFRASRVTKSFPEFTNGGAFESTTPIALQTGFPMSDLERTVLGP